MAKKRVLPKDFFRTMGAATLDELIAVYDDHLLTAYQGGDQAKRTPLFWALTPNGLVEWLVEQGLDVNEPDASGVSALFAQANSSKTYPETPQRYPGKVRLLLSLGADVHRRSPSGIGGETTALHIAAFRGAGGAVETLLEWGAEADALDGEGRTPLGLVVARSKLSTLDTLAEVVRPLIAAGAKVTAEMRAAIVLLGREIDAIKPGSAAADAARYDAAYGPVAQLFDLDAAAGETAGEVTDEILVPRASWSAQHRALWHALVPKGGPAPTAQGEAIRIGGRIRYEILEMGGINWDADFRAMLEHLPRLLALGVPLDNETLTRVQDWTRRLRTGRHTQSASRWITELQQAAVAWVSMNTTPIPLQTPPYNR